MGILSWRMVLRDVVVWRHAGRGATGRRGPGVVGGIGGAPGTVGAAAPAIDGAEILHLIIPPWRLDGRSWRSEQPEVCWPKEEAVVGIEPVAR